MNVSFFVLLFGILYMLALVAVRVIKERLIINRFPLKPVKLARVLTTSFAKTFYFIFGLSVVIFYEVYMTNYAESYTQNQ